MSNTESVAIRPLAANDEAAWRRLAEGYKAFYKTKVSTDQYALTWSRLLLQDGVHGIAATRKGEVLGIAHFLLHTSVWSAPVCYLEDLFVTPTARGQGVARALIDAVASRAVDAGAARFYWSTHESNATARRLYDQVARHLGFLRYDYPLRPSVSSSSVLDMNVLKETP